MAKYKESKKILKEIVDQYVTSMTFTECKEALKDIDNFLPESNLDTYDTDFNVAIGGMDYRIIHNNSLESVIDEYLEQYIDDCILPEIPEHYQSYFDNEAFKRDCRMEGVGRLLNGYDGVELETTNYTILCQG